MRRRRKRYFSPCFNNSFATASPNSLVVADPLISGVQIPESITARTADSMVLASSGMHKEYLSIIATDKIMPTGLTMPFPAMSGADPVLYEYN